VPEHFRFAVKVPKAIPHDRQGRLHGEATLVGWLPLGKQGVGTVNLTFLLALAGV
jgi:uncharacterized protein YecE (DUF72 family)